MVEARQLQELTDTEEHEIGAWEGIRFDPLYEDDWVDEVNDEVTHDHWCYLNKIGSEQAF